MIATERSGAYEGEFRIEGHPGTFEEPARNHWLSVVSQRLVKKRLKSVYKPSGLSGRRSSLQPHPHPLAS